MFRIIVTMGAGALAIGSALAPIEASAQDRRVRVVNNTSRTMTMLQASNTARRTWEEDILGRNVLRPGQATMANINDGTGACLFDFRATFSGGVRAQRRMNVCQVRSWTITD